MVVCLCQGISDRLVRRAIADGATSRRDVTRACGAGGACGGCHREIVAMLRQGGAASERGASEAAQPAVGWAEASPT